MIQVPRMTSTNAVVGVSLAIRTSANTVVRVSSAIRIGTAFVRPSHISRKSRVSRRALCAMVSSNMKKEDFYSVLGVRRSATRDEIKSAYRRLARVLHPDASPSAPQNHHIQGFITLQEAYSVLYNPESRAKYDRGLAASGGWSESGSSMCVRRCTRNWETNQCW